MTTHPTNPALSEALSAAAFTSVDGLALNAVLSKNPAEIAAAKDALLAARHEFMREYESLPFHTRRLKENQLASAAALLR